MKKTLISIAILAFLAANIVPVFAVGHIIVEPYNPVTVASPADFGVYMSDSKTSYDPHIFLVMTEECMGGLVGNVVVTWTGGSLTITTWNYESGLVQPEPKVPPNTVEGAGYTVASLQSHLETEDGIYWAFEPFLGSAMLSSTPKNFTVTINSDATRMLVYVLGKASETDTLFTDRVPPTNPGFIVPEAATIVMAVSSMSALGLYALKRKKK